MDITEADQDRELVSKIVQGDSTALDSIMTKYQKPLYFFVLRYVHDDDLAYDIVQETFFRIYTKANKYKPSYHFTTWMYQIALNLCRDHGRKQAFQKFYSISDSQSGEKHNAELAHNASIEECYEKSSDISALQIEISKLPHKLKSALILFALEENSQAKCSDILKISQKSVETRVYRAKKILVQRMRKYSEG